MKDQVPDQIKAARSAELLELNRKKQAVYEERLIGTTQEVLIEEEKSCGWRGTSDQAHKGICENWCKKSE